MGLGQCKRSRAVCKGGPAVASVTAEPHEPSERKLVVRRRKRPQMKRSRRVAELSSRAGHRRKGIWGARANPAKIRKMAVAAKTRNQSSGERPSFGSPSAGKPCKRASTKCEDKE